MEAQFFMNEEHLLIGRRFDTKELAVQWAERERTAIERDEDVFSCSPRCTPVLRTCEKVVPGRFLIGFPERQEEVPGSEDR